jgi:phosphopantetheine--protein transferase-like protein
VQNPRFVARVFTRREADYCRLRYSNGNGDSARGVAQPKNDIRLGHAIHFAGCWAAKEAVVKSVGTGFVGFFPRDVEIARDESGKPYVVPLGTFRDKCDALRLGFHLSIAHSGTIATATCIAMEMIA